MSRTNRVVALALAGVVATGGLAATAANSGATATVEQPSVSSATQTLVFTTPWGDVGDFTYVDLGKKGEGPGDLFLFGRIPMHARGERVGTLEGTETIISAAHIGTVTQEVTLRLPGGRVMVSGAGRHDDTPFQLAVVGGTGRFLKARGMLVVVGEDEERKVSIWRLTIVR